MTNPPEFKPTMSRPLPGGICTGITRNGPRAGERCGRASLAGTTVCLKHGAGNPVVQKFAQDMVSAARMEIMGSTDEAVKALFDLMQNASSEAIRLKSAEAILDRANIRAGSELSIVADITDTRAIDVLNERLDKLKSGAQRKADRETDALLSIDAAPEELDAESVSEDITEAVEGEVLPAGDFPPGYIGRLSRHRPATELVEVPGTGADVSSDVLPPLRAAEEADRPPL